jgi:hypothetical protein
MRCVLPRQVNWFFAGLQPIDGEITTIFTTGHFFSLLGLLSYASGPESAPDMKNCG